MKTIKQFIILILLFNSLLMFGQSFEFGALFNLERTTLAVPNGELTINIGSGAISEGADNTGFETNFGLGLFAIFQINQQQNIGVELFYDRTTSKGLENLSFSAANLVAYIDYDIFNIDLFIDLGVGVGYILNNPEFGQNVDVEDFDVIGKIGLAYKFENLGRIEIGTYQPVTDIVKDNLRRSKGYFGIKIPLDKYFR